MHMWTACLYLMHFRLPVLVRSLLLLKTHAGKVAKLMASFALVFLMGIGTPPHALNHHTWNILTCHCVPLLCQIFSWVALANGTPLGLDSCSWVAWVSYLTFSFCTSQLEALFSGV